MISDLERTLIGKISMVDYEGRSCLFLLQRSGYYGRNGSTSYPK